MRDVRSVGGRRFANITDADRADKQLWGWDSNPQPNG